MTIMAVDNHKRRLAKLKDILQKAFCNDDIICFADPMLAAQYSFHHKICVVFTDFNTHPIDGQKLAEGVNRKNPNAKTYYITDMLCIDSGCVSNCLVRPVTLKKLKQLIVSDCLQK